jgi:hypothetical protein
MAIDSFIRTDKIDTFDIKRVKRSLGVINPIKLVELIKN